MSSWRFETAKDGRIASVKGRGEGNGGALEGYEQGRGTFEADEGVLISPVPEVFQRLRTSCGCISTNAEC